MGNQPADMLVRPYAVAVDGFPETVFHAASRGRALADAWNSYAATRGPVTFGAFMRIARAKAAEPGPRHAERIVVGGRDAYLIGYDGHHVQFALPGARKVLNSHPLDVETPHGEPFRR